MISYLRGKIKLLHPGFIILDVSGVGYKIFCNLESSENSELELFIHENIREDCDDLYGFATYDELELFQKLISVNGVGPKAGLSIISSNKYEKIIQAILSDDAAFFQSISGIGKKVAAKIILELKSKVGGLLSSETLSRVGNSTDLIDALSSLGYKNNEINAVISNLPHDVGSTEDKIRWCLKNLTKN